MDTSAKICYGCMKPLDKDYDVCPYCGYTEDTSMISNLHIKPGTVLKDRYIVGKTIGYGGYGVTYIGYDTKLERKIAIKEYLPSEFATRQLDSNEVVVENTEKKLRQFEKGKAKFNEEGQKLAQVSNIENVVHMYDCFEENGTAYITMEYLEGQTLEKYLEQNGQMSEKETLEIMLPLLEALSNVHNQGILHRDISPDNIFLIKDREGKTVAKLIDFGAAKYATVAQSSKSLTVIVKKGYSPEEQYRSKGNQGVFTDVYSVAAVMYRMLTGVVPPDALERRISIETGKRDTLQPIEKYRKDISENVETAILNALNVKVEDRTGSVADFVGELVSFETVPRRGPSIRKIDFFKWPLWAKITVPLAMIFAVCVIVFAVNRIFTNPEENVILPEGMTRVPEFISAKIDDAIEKGEKAQILVKSVNDEYVPGGKSEIVLTQDVAYGLVVPENQLVSVTVSTSKQEYAVPDVRGMHEDLARYALEAMGLEVLIEEGTQKGLASGCVIEQSIEPFKVVNAGETITLKINKTDKKPSRDDSLKLTGLGYDEALSKADAKGVQCTVVEKVFDKKRKDGEIIKAEYNADGILELTVSLAFREFEMPNLKYKNQDIATQLLKNIGITPEVEHEYSNSIAEDLVFDQSVKTSTKVSPGEAVQLKVSRGSKPFSMPSVIKMKQEEAEKTLKDLKLTVSVEYDYSSDIEEGCVMSQSVDAGTDVRIGDAVTIYVCTKEATKEVSNVVGKGSTEAKEALEKQGFEVQLVEAYSDTVEKGKVIQQLPEASTKQKIGTMIVLTVSKGAAETKNSGGSAAGTNNGTVAQGSGSGSQNTGGTGGSNSANGGNGSSSSGKNSSGNGSTGGSSSGNSAWSDWSTSLPSGVSSSKYEIEQRTQYRSRTKETTTSANSSMPGWTLYDQREAWSDYGRWSDWSTNQTEANVTTKVQSKTQFSISTRSTTTSKTSSTMNGWTLYNTNQEWSDYGAWSAWSTTQPTEDEYTKTDSKKQYRSCTKNRTSSREANLSGWVLENTAEEWGEYGSWSSWSTTPVASNEATDVETKTQYRYQDKNYTTSTDSSMPGWTLEGQDYEYGEWSSWSDWQPMIWHYTGSDDVEYRGGYQYYYGYYYCGYCNYQGGPRFAECPNCHRSDNIISEFVDSYIYEEPDTAPDTVEINGTIYYKVAIDYPKKYRTRSKTLVYTFSQWGDWSSWQDNPVGASSSRNVETQTLYRYRTRSKVKVYHYWQWSGWSDWQDSEITPNSDRGVDTQTVYRSAKREKIYTYYFEKWSDWSSWSDTSYAESSERKVKTRTVYRYATRNKQYTYFFERFGAWSDYGDTPIAPSGNVDVQTRVVYRYRKK